MAEIAYPSTVKTDDEKLGAVYALIEQMRLEHNRQGALARGDWSKYGNNWYRYALRPKRLGGNLFTEKLLPLLEEQNRLRDKIRADNYSSEAWRDLTDEARDAAFLEMFGDKEKEKSKPTAASSELLDELKSVSLDSLAGESPPDPTEDLTTFTEYDDESNITITASRVTATNITRVSESYVYKDYGVYNTIKCTK